MKTTIETDLKTLEAMLTDAGAGIAYWADCADRAAPFVLRVRERETQQWHDVDLQRALGLLPSVAKGRHLAAMLADEYDAETCDVLVQLGAFGEVRYG